MSIKYPACVCVLGLAIAACVAAPPLTASPSPVSTVTLAPAPPATRAAGLIASIAAQADRKQRWWTLPDGLLAAPAAIWARFDTDPSAGTPVARLRPSGRETPLTVPVGVSTLGANIDLEGLAPGPYAVDIVEHLAGGGESVVATTEIVVSRPEYVVWTLDFEGDASGDAEMANTAAIADGLKVPMTVLWNPRAWTSGVPPGESAVVSGARADAMLAWTKDRHAKGDEVGLHLHMWTDYVRAAGLTPRLTPSWAGRSDGYDVPITAYPEADQKALIDYGSKLMSDHGLPKPTSFRAGGQFGDAATLRALVSSGFSADCTAVAAGTFGRLRLPWTLAADAQPYRPSREDANAAGDLPILESPTIGGNTFGFTTQTIQPQIRANLAVFASPGEVAKERRTVHVVSHPGTIVPTERAAIEALLKAFDPLRYDRDAGPVRFVTLVQLAKAFGR